MALLYLNVAPCVFRCVVRAGEAGSALTGVSAEGEQGGRGGGAEGPVYCSGPERGGGRTAEGRV